MRTPITELTVWGIAQPGRHAGTFTVQACRSRDDAQINAGRAGPVTTAHGKVSALVYHHPDGRWVFAATGWPCPTGGDH